MKRDEAFNKAISCAVAHGTGVAVRSENEWTVPSRGDVFVAIITWRSIETAPKDGTLIDLWSADHNRLTNCFWGHSWDDPEDQKWRRQYAENPGTSFSINCAPTHWMPIPESPK